MTTATSATDPSNPAVFERLHEAVEWSNLQLEFQRRKRVEAVQLLVGSHHTEQGYPSPIPVNFLKMAKDIYVRALAPAVPRAMISTFDVRKKPTAAKFELALNEIPKEIKFGETMRRLVSEAIFSLGVLRVGLETTDQIMGINYGDIFAEVITIDDYVVDMVSPTWGNIQYEGCSYWVDYEDLMDSKLVDKKARDGLSPDEWDMTGEHGEYRVENVAVDESVKTYRDRIWVRDVYLPRERLLVTYGIKSKKLFKVVEWKGPPQGPFHKLGFTDVPGLLFPMPPVQAWRDLHELGNAVFRKLGIQADGQKSVLGFNGGNDEGVSAFKRARDGDGIVYQGSPPQELKAGGVRPDTLAFYMQVRDLSSYFAGNLDSLGGLAPLTQTVGQDRLLGESASAQLRDMADSVTRFTQGVFESFAYYEWNDPIKVRNMELKARGTDVKIPVEFGPDDKIGPLDAFNTKIDVYSMQDQSPEIKLQKLGMVMQQYVMPLMPAIQAAGGTLDVQKILSQVAKLSDTPEVDEMIMWTETETRPDQAGGGPGQPGGPREYVHTSRPGATQAGVRNNLMQQLQGGNLQNSQAAQQS
jgi:hypothetical protein